MYKRGKHFYERFVYPDGKEKRICLETGDPKLAEKVKAKLQVDILMDKHFDQKRLAKKRSVKQMINKLYDLAEANYAEDSKVTETFKKKVLINRFGDLMLDSVTPEIIEDFIKEQRDRGLKENTIMTRVRTFKKYWYEAMNKHKWTENNPFEEIETPRPDFARVRYLSDEERERLLEAFNCSRYLWLRDYMIVACDTGLRRKNMCRMTWDHVDFDRQTLNFKASEMKNGKAHTMMMTEHVFNVLKRRHDFLEGENPVFRNFHGGVITPRTLSTQFTKLTAKFGVSDFHLHDMRHDFCSQLALNGAELYDIADMAGHSDIKQTMRYIHLMPERKKKAIDILNGRKLNKIRAVG